ncbi:MAG TPA: hypothetical protein DCE23_07415, partial [Firmicutes bacterium]|nr:hypothetical protein [Bacillota bacterium]
KYPIVLDNVKNYNLPYKRHIDASKSTYNIYIKSTDNIVLNVTEIINITYFDPSIYPNEVIDELNLKSINYNYFPESNPIDEEFYKNQDEIEKKPEYPNNWLDIYNYPIEDINNDTITNYCNTY